MDKLIQGSLEYLKAFSGTKSHKSESQLEVARKTQVENLKRQIGKLKDVSMSDGTSALSLLACSPFTPEETTQLEQVVNAKIGSGTDDIDDTPNEKKQVHPYLGTYLPMSKWTSIEDKSLDEDQHVRDLVDWTQDALNLYYPDPETRKSMVGILALAINATPNAISAKRVYDKITKYNNKRRAKSKLKSLTINHYPEDVRVFMDMCPSAYAADDPPVESRVSTQKLQQIVDYCPARKTHSLIVRESPTSSSMGDMHASMQPMQPQMPDMMHMFQAMMSFAQNSRQQQCPGLDVFTPKRSKSMPMLEDGSGKRRPSPSEHKKRQLALDDDRHENHDEENEAEESDASNLSDAIDNSVDASADSTAFIKKMAKAKLEAKEAKAVVAKAKEAKAKEAKEAKAAAKGSISTKPSSPSKEVPLLTESEPSKSMKKRPASAIEWTTEPPFKSAKPLTYLGCRILENKGKFRVFPRPGESLYDKGFVFKCEKTKADAWKSAMSFCLDPKIPETSKNKPK
jgi:hypothetical protein